MITLKAAEGDLTRPQLIGLKKMTLYPKKIIYVHCDLFLLKFWFDLMVYYGRPPGTCHSQKLFIGLNNDVGDDDGERVPHRRNHPYSTHNFFFLKKSYTAGQFVPVVYFTLFA